MLIQLPDLEYIAERMQEENQTEDTITKQYVKMVF